MSDQKVCLVYQDDNGNTQRTRFHKPTSKFILKRKHDVLVRAGKKPQKMNRKVWEFEMGPINNKRSASIPHRDLRFVEKTHEMKSWQYQHERSNGKPLAY